MDIYGKILGFTIIVIAAFIVFMATQPVRADSPAKELQQWMSECTNWETGEGCPQRPLSKQAQALSDRCSNAGDEEAIGKCIDDAAPPRTASLIPPHTVRAFQCGAVIMQVDIKIGPSWNQTTYTVINPDAIPYIRDGGPARYFFEWNSNRRGELITLNGWPCAALR